jgi:hypothetical protein
MGAGPALQLAYRLPLIRIYKDSCELVSQTIWSSRRLVGDPGLSS